jgi:hypothetical protein
MTVPPGQARSEFKRTPRERDKRKRCGAVCLGVVAILLGTLSASASGARQATSPCPGVPFASPPLMAPAAPPVECSSTLLGIGNVASVITSPHGQRSGFYTIKPAALQRSFQRSSFSTVCAYGYSWGYMDKAVSQGNPSYVVSTDTAATKVAVTSPTTDEHSIAGSLEWDNANTGQWVQMGYWRGLGPSGWTDTLSPDQVMIYLEFNASGGAYQWSPLFAVAQGSRHEFKMTQDGSGHYHNFYLDGNLKWANVYLDQSPNRALAGNEDFNRDSSCEPGFSDNNFFNVAFNHTNPNAGHAVGVVSQGGPWQSDQTDLTSDLPAIGYQCGANPGRLYWYCGV